MGKYVGRLVASFLMYLIALVLLVVIGLMIYGWIYDSFGNWYYFDWTKSTSQLGDDSEYSRAIIGLLIASVSLTGLCVLLSFIMMCADCCCRITKCMTVIPKITTGFGTVAGLLADIACVIFIIKIYVVQDFEVLGLKFYPGYSFYIVGATGLLLMVAGCILAGVKHATEVEDVPVTVTASSNASQSQGMAMYQTQQMPVGYPGYQAAPGVQPFYPQSNFYATNNGQAMSARIFMTNAATQTWTEDGKKK